MIASVQAQDDPDWEWILVDDASRNGQVREVLRAAAAQDPRIQVVERERNGHIVRASNDALERASGQWIVLVDHDDLLPPHALSTMATAIGDHPDAGYLYSDEDKLGPDGTHFGEFAKPDWSPERLRHQMYLGHLSVLRADLVREVGGFREGFDGSQDHDLALRVTEQAAEVVHVPEILYHWRVVTGTGTGDADAKNLASEAGLRAVRDHLDRIGQPETRVELADQPHTYRTVRTLDPSTMVSVVIPTRGDSGDEWGQQVSMVVSAVRSLLESTDHPLFEIVVVYDDVTPPDVLTDLENLAGSRLVLVRYEQEFSFSDKCNTGFLASAGDVVGFLNDDIVIQSANFLEQLCAPLAQESVGMTGAKLLYPDGTLQHGGHVYRAQELFHAYTGAPRRLWGRITTSSSTARCPA